MAGKSLTKREREVFLISLTGCGRNEVAKRLGLSPNTVSTHVTRGQRKLGARNPFHALVIFMRAEAGPAVEPFYRTLEKIEREGLQ